METEKEEKNETDVQEGQELIAKINRALDAREQWTIVFNGMSYTTAYEYNQRKAINYITPRGKEDRQISYGLIHEKVVAFCAIFVKYAIRNVVKCYDAKNNLIPGLGTFYELAIAFSRKIEGFDHIIAKIYWETFSQGNAFVYEDWEVKTYREKDLYVGGEKVDFREIDQTLEYLDNAIFKDGTEVQTRKAKSRVLDGRSVIFGNPEIEDVQEQPFITLEFEYDRSDAEKMFGSLKKWGQVPRTRTEILSTTGFNNRNTLFNSKRWTDTKNKVLAHFYFDNKCNRYNLFLNGLMMFGKDTPMSFFYPDMKYPISNIPCERLNGSIYARSIPMKTKFNDDYINWLFAKLAIKLEQGIEPAIITTTARGTLTRDMFMPGKVTTGITSQSYALADPNNKGVTQGEFSFVNLMKDIIETQTLSATTTGEAIDATATAVTLADAGQQAKLAYLMDGIVMGLADMASRRLETIRYKYTIPRDETIVDGRKVLVYNDFSVDYNGVRHNVEFSDYIPVEGPDLEAMRYAMFSKAHQSKKAGTPSEFYKVSPATMLDKGTHHFVESKMERIKDSQLQKIELYDEFAKLLNIFGDDVNKDELKNIFLEASGRSPDIFVPKEVAQLKQQLMQANMAQAGATPEQIPKQVQGTVTPENTGSLGRNGPLATARKVQSQMTA